jgi:saccharopine dehydrogenase (NAD+, L-lysine-forming)
MTILILGGYGFAGLPTARLLLENSDVRLVLAGRHLDLAEKEAAELNAAFPGGRVSGRYADASKPETLETAFEGVGMVLVCSATAQYAGQVAQAALKADCDYLDIIYSQKRLMELQALEPKIKEASRCFITEAGIHPGAPATLIRYAAAKFTNLRKVMIAMVISTKHLGSVSSTTELLKDMNDYQGYLYKEGKWQKAGYKQSKTVDFGVFGKRMCIPGESAEIKRLPQELGLTEVGIYLAGFNWFVDYLVFPLGMILGKINKGLGTRMSAKMLLWGCRTFAKPPYGIGIKLEAESAEGQTLNLLASHEDGYEATAIATVACLLQYLDGSANKPGLWMMGHLIDPIRAKDDMAKMGMRFEEI